MKKRLIAALLCLTMILTMVCAALPTSAQAADVKTMDEFGIVGEWMWGSTIADAGEDGAEKLIGRCAEMGITDVYLLVKGTGGGLSWLNTEFTDRLSRTDRDVLQEAIDAAHAHGIRLHAWICNMEDAAYKEANPEAGMWHYVRERDNNRINPYDEGYQEYMVKIVQELAAYDIDGIHFDYIRYNHLANGWSETDFANLEAMGADVAHVKEMIEKTFGYNGWTADSSYIFTQFDNGDKDAQLVAEYRRNNIVAYAEKIIAAAKEANPDLIISAALQPEGAYDLSFSGLHYGQNYTDAAALYDYVTPMAYTKDFGMSSSWVAKVAKGAIDKGNKVVMGLQSYYPATSVDLMGDVEAVRGLLSDETYGDNVLGIVHFRNSQFGYAKVSYDLAAKTMTIKTINPSTTYPYAWVQVDLQDGLKAVSGAVVDGYSDGTAVEVGEDYVKFHGTDILGMDSEGTLTISYEGDLDLSKAPAIVRIYMTNESRAYNVYENVTPVAEIVSNPVAQSVALGDSATFVVEATGAGLQYQWQTRPNGSQSWVDIEGATEAAYTVTNADLDDHDTDYRCVVSDAFGSEVASGSAHLHVNLESDVRNEFGIVGEWLWASTIYEAGVDGAKDIIGRSAENGVTDIYLMVKGTAGKVYYLEGEVPLAVADYSDADNFAKNPRDILQEVLDEAHARGIRVHAWFTGLADKTYAQANDDARLWHYIRKHDLSVNTDNEKQTIDATDEGYLNYMKALIAELAENYDIDGIHFDYIRYNHLANGWGENDFANLEAMGADVARVKELIEKTQGYNGYTADSTYIFNQYLQGDKDAQLIVKYRSENIRKWSSEIIAAAKAANPDLVASAAYMPESAMLPGDYDNAFGLLHYGQDYSHAAEIYDYICPMAYRSQYADSATWMAQTAVNAIEQGNKVVMGLQSYSGSVSKALMEDIEAVRYLLETEYADDVLGIVHFRTSQFRYVQAAYDTNEKTITVRLDSPGSKLVWIEYVIQDGLTITDVDYSDANLTVAEAAFNEGNTAFKISGEPVLPEYSEATVTIKYQGELDPSKAPVLVRICTASNEIRAYHTYNDATIYPEVVSAPENQDVALGDSTTFAVEVTGAGELSYQWYTSPDLKYGTLWTPIEGATEATYTVSAAKLEDDGVKYRCVVTDAYGNSVTSGTAKLHVSVPSDFSNEFEIVGEWMWASSISELGDDGAEILMDRCLENGITDVYLLVKGTNGTVSYLKGETPLARTEYPLDANKQERDILQEAIDAAHARGIRLHAWICNMEDKTFKATYEDAGLWHYVRARDNNRIHPADERYQTYMANLVTELVENYDIDGIHMDYIRYNHMSNGWSEQDFAALEAMGANIDRVKELIEITQGYNGRTADPEYIFDAFNAGDPDAKLIYEYRRGNVMSYSDKIIGAAKAANPDLIISAALQPETVLDQAWGGIHYGNNFADFAEDYDYVCPMTYTADFAQCSTWVARTAAAAIEAGNKVVMGLQSYYPLTSADLASDIEAVRYLLDTEYADSVLGIAHFRTTQFGYATNYYMENVEVDGEKHGVMLIHLTNPGGTYQWVQVELQDGLKVLDYYIPESFELEEGVTITNNLSADVDVEVPADGSYIKVSGTDIVGKNSDGWLAILFDGEIDPTVAPSLTRIYITNESRAYNTFYNLASEVDDPEPTDPTDPEPTDPEPTDPQPTDPEPTTPGGASPSTGDAMPLVLLTTLLCLSAAGIFAAIILRKKFF